MKQILVGLGVMISLLSICSGLWWLCNHYEDVVWYTLVGAVVLGIAWWIGDVILHPENYEGSDGDCW